MDAYLGNAASMVLSVLSMGLLGRRPTTGETDDDQKRKWQKVGKLKQIFSYPLEGGYRQEAAKAFCTPYNIQPVLSGCQYFLDRCLFIYNPTTKGALLNVPKMTAIKITANPKNQAFKLQAPDHPDLIISGHKISKKATHVRYWDDKLKMNDCGDDAAKWVSMYLIGCETFVRLAISNGLLRRKSSKINNVPKTSLEEKTQYVLSMKPDFSAFSLISQATLEELDSKIPDVTITGEQLRFNFVIEFDPEHNTPFNEDRFEFIKIGEEAEFRDVILCNPNELICVDPDTRTTYKSGEPLKTIKRLRALKKLSPVYADFDEPVVGVNLDIESEGTVAVGDDVYVQFRLTR